MTDLLMLCLTAFAFATGFGYVWGCMGLVDRGGPI